MSSHKVEAESTLASPLASPANDPHGYALAHATLYLAEQQRIANKIAIALVAQLGELASVSVPEGYVGRDPRMPIDLILTPAEEKELEP